MKFRYCSYCKAPVAKRNFRRRHNHGGDTSTVESDDNEDDSAKVSALNSINSTKRLSRDNVELGAKRSKYDAASSKDENMMMNSSKSPSDYDGKSALAKRSFITTTKQVSTDDCPNDEKEDHRIHDIILSTIKSKTRDISQEQRVEWAKLLDERPLTGNSEAISKWINKILEVSGVRGKG